MPYFISRVDAAYQRHQSQQPGGGPTGVNGALTADGGLVPLCGVSHHGTNWPDLLRDTYATARLLLLN